jgi:predicted RNase H-like nuclease
MRPFIRRVRDAVEGRYVIATDNLWREFVAEVPSVAMTGATLKQIEDRWDALLCALAVALEFLAPGTMMLYPDGPRSSRAGAILAPVLC